MENSYVEQLSIRDVSLTLDQQEQVAMTLARSQTLVRFNYRTADDRQTSPFFCNHFCAALSNYFETKLEQWI